MRNGQEFLAENGSEYMIIDCDDYNVKIYKSKDTESCHNCIEYTRKDGQACTITQFVFNINWDKEEIGGKLTLKHKGNWGCSMTFEHYDPMPIKSLFDFIGNGYGILKNMNL